MSVIYDALNKLDKSKSPDVKPDPKKGDGPGWKIYLLCGVVVFFGYFAARALFGHISKDKYESFTEARETKVARINAAKAARLSAMKSSIPKALAAFSKEIAKPKHLPLVLDGIVYAADDSYALINNKILKVGDKIEGAKVLRIEQDYVELKTADSKPFKLTTVSNTKRR
jgi:hypothetical protein